MPWQEASAVSLRNEFVVLAEAEGANVRELCRRFGISPTTGYKWVERYRVEGVAGLLDRVRRPRRSPARTCSEVEQTVVEARDAHRVWGARKLRRWLLNQGYGTVPSPSTVTAILKRHGRIDPTESAKHRPWQRFEHDSPNKLWQMDFKGHFAVVGGERCHPLTVLDDHSRFALGLEACGDEMGDTVRQRLANVFRRYGLPQRMIMDHGSPWGSNADHPYTPLTVWLMCLGVAISHGRPHHPQTQGKDERFHRTLKAELLQGRTFSDVASCQRAFDNWRTIYNLERPHEALGMATPASRYQISSRPYPEVLPPLEYGSNNLVRKVQGKGEVYFHGRPFRVGKAFRGLPVALRPTTTDGVWDVLFSSYTISTIDLTKAG